MKDASDYIKLNKATWNDKVDVHMASSFYDMEAFLKGKSTLNDIELAFLGDVSGKKILHLQCHFGQDSLSLARMGAQVTGVDLSDKAIQRAQELAEKLNMKATFVCCDIYEAPKLIDEKFDLVFTSYGTIGWFPDLERWAGVVAHFLKPNGQLIMADFHPVVWMYDNDFTTVFYDYFNVAPIVEAETGTYADREAPIENKTVTWNHPISEILNALIDSGLEIKRFNEYNYSPYNCFNQTEEFDPEGSGGKYRIKAFGNKIPMVYAILASRK